MSLRAELLAPAGSFLSAKAAVNAGADAVYMGGRRFGALADDADRVARGGERLDPLPPGKRIC